MNPAAMVALIDYREIDGEERPVTPISMLITVLLQKKKILRVYSMILYSLFYPFLIPLQAKKKCFR